jgi:ABC-type nitrate/sulfonate/bicarbonate transport system substrate-binding protein
VVSLAAVIAHNTSSLLAPADRGITRPADLQGKTYGGFGGELERALIDDLVRCDGGDPSTVRFVDVGNVDFRVGFDRGDYDFVWVFDGWDGLRLGELGGLDVTTIPFIEHTDCIPDWYTPVIATNEALVGSDPELVRGFMAATARGYAEAMADPAAAADALLEAAPESDADLVRRSAEYLATRYAESPAAWGRQDPAVWARFTEFVQATGLVDGEVVSEEAFTNEFLPADG